MLSILKSLGGLHTILPIFRKFAPTIKKEVIPICEQLLAEKLKKEEANCNNDFQEYTAYLISLHDNEPIITNCILSGSSIIKINKRTTARKTISDILDIIVESTNNPNLQNNE